MAHRNARPADVVNGPRESPPKRQCLVENADYWASSELEQETFSFVWNIEKYSSLVGIESIKSPIFLGGPKTNHSWKMNICSRKPQRDKYSYSYLQPVPALPHLLKVYLGLSEYNGGIWSKLTRVTSTNIMCRYRICFLDANGQAALEGEDKVYQFNNSQGESWDTEGSRYLISDILSPTRRLLEDDRLKIHCRISILGKPHHKNVIHGIAKAVPAKVPSDDEKDKIRYRGLLSDLGKLFKEGNMTDIEISTAKTSFKAHKAILSARSPVFAAMLSTNMLEKEQNSVKILDFEDDVVRGMLEHIYTGQTDLINVRPSELLQIADKYDLPFLKEDCEYKLAESLSLSMENVAAVLVVAQSHNAPFLKDQTIEFINCNLHKLKNMKSFQDVAQANKEIFANFNLSQ
ncbi:Speckle-type POZ protein-like B [Orchesella cincta]|uniref:Speckle-type POZ protein-like B n=1 Tax=Orchesella cincta TaxID=48709 RepID=A0A1D2NB93_ORCCI|nr:Speckle-type POZ protein-like B [Orchesella cincta]